jgi:hypothetical protein
MSFGLKADDNFRQVQYYKAIKVIIETPSRMLKKPGIL